MIIITGATGFLGSSFIPHLAKENPNEIVCLIPNSKTVRMAGREISESKIMQEFNKLGAKILNYPSYGSVDDYKEAFSAIDKITTVVYMAANNNQKDIYDNLYRDNVKVIELFMSSLGERLRDTRFIFTSSIMAKNCKDMLDNGINIEILKKIAPYGLSKLMAEQIIIEYSKKFGFKPVIFRLASIYGKDSATGFMKSIDKLARISRIIPIPRFPGRIGIISVDALALLLTRVTLSKKDYEDIYYYADDGLSLTVGDMISNYGKNNDFKTRQFKVPKFASKAISSLSLKCVKSGIAPALSLMALFEDNYMTHDTRIWNIEKIMPKEFKNMKPIEIESDAKQKGLRVAIIGANGMIGSRLIKPLLSKGFCVRCGIHKNNKIQHVGENIEFMQCNIQSENSIESFVHRQDVVIHAGGLIPTHKKNKKEEYYKINVEGTSKVVNACINSGVKKFIFFGTQAAFASAKGKYGKSKYEAEKIVECSKLNWTILKPGQVVYKEGFITKVSTKIMRNARFVPVPLGAPKNLELIDIDVLCNAVVKISHEQTDKFSNRIIYFGCSERVSIEQVLIQR